MGFSVLLCRVVCLTLISSVVGAKVIATAGSQEKLEVCRKYGGADYVLNYRNPGWQKEVQKITGGKGVGALCCRSIVNSMITMPVDVIYDPVGLIKDSLKCIAWKGRAVVIGFAGGAIEKVSSFKIALLS